VETNGGDLNPAMISWRCVTCGADFTPDGSVRTCPRCGPIAGTLDVIYDPESLAASLSSLSGIGIGRYAGLLPVRPRETLLVGNTPLIESEAIANQTDVGHVWLKDDTRLPSCSLKDRASAICTAEALESGAQTIAVASTGNAAASTACIAAALGLKSVVFVPADAPPAKLAQVAAHGAHIISVDGTYDDAFDLCSESCSRYGWYPRNTATNPLCGEGKKTVALEVWEALGDAVDAVFVPTGDGCILGGVHKAYTDLSTAEALSVQPQLFGVQAEGCDPLAAAFWNRTTSSSGTVCDSIAVATPRDRTKALRAARSTGGAILSVGDDAILTTARRLARDAGLFVEPSAAAAVAGIVRARELGLINTSARVVALLTGHGLKDSRPYGASLPEPIKPTIEALSDVLARTTDLLPRSDDAT
jgi:threonine synthase